MKSTSGFATTLRSFRRHGYNPQTIVVDGFSKTYAMTGWRLGFAHGPAELVQEMAKLPQYTFVSPQPV